MGVVEVGMFVKQGLVGAGETDGGAEEGVVELTCKL